MIKVIDHKTQIPFKERIIGVVGDNDVAVRQFEIDRYLGEIDLSEYSATIELQFEEQPPFYDILAKDVSDEKITLTWSIKKHDVAYAGKLMFNLWFGNSDKEQRVYQTYPDYFECIGGIDAENLGAIIPPSVFEQAVMEATKQAGIAKEYAEDVLANGGYVDKPFYDAIMEELNKKLNDAPKDSQFRARRNGKWEVLPNAEKESGRYGLVKLGSNAKGIDLTGDGELILKQATLANLENNSTQLVVTKPSLHKHVIALGTHQQMNNKYNVNAILVPSSFDGRQGELPASYKAVKGYVDNERKLKLLKTITLAEDVASLDVKFDKPLDEIVLFFDVAFLVEETKAMAAKTDQGSWYMFWAGGAMKNTKQLFFVHAKEFAEYRWETFASGGFFGTTQGISASTTTPKHIISTRDRIPIKSRFVNDLNIFITNNTSGNAFTAGSTIEIWGHEAE